MNAASFEKRKPRIARIHADDRNQKSALIREIRGQSPNVLLSRPRSGAQFANDTKIAAENAEYADDTDFYLVTTFESSASSVFSAAIMSRNT